MSEYSVLDDDDERTLDEIEQVHKKRMAILNKKKLSKRELDELFE